MASEDEMRLFDTPFMQDNGPAHADDLDPPAFREADEETRESAAGDLDMSDEDYENLIAEGIKAAEDYVDNEISPDRNEAARYYRGEPFGNENVGESAVVMSEVRDAVLAMMPALMRMFAGTTNAVEFTPNAGTPVEQADQQTAYVNHVIMKDNPGFQIFYAGIKDALVRKTGVFTWWHEEKEVVTESRFSDITEEALAFLQQEAQAETDDGMTYEVVITGEKPDPDAELTLAGIDETQNTMQPRQLYTGSVRRVEIRKRVRVAAVPPEEFIVAPTTSDNIDEFPLVGRRTMKTIGELVAIGHDEDEIRELIGGHGVAGGSGTSSLDQNEERIDRKYNYDRVFENDWLAADPASEEVKYCVVYVEVDRDGDGIAERRKICTVGEANKIIYDEIYDDDMVPFGTLCPDPEPHSPFGYSIADQTMDIQEIKSEMVRGMLDSLADSLVGKTYFQEGQVNIDDLLNTENRALIRTKGIPSNTVMHQNRQFLGANVMPVLDYIDTVKMRRTGVNPASPSGLDPEALQSTAKEGVQSLVDASQDRLELIARIFAETGFTRLMKGVRNLILRHQDKPRTLQLLGTIQTVDPRSWNADLETEPNVGVGKGSQAKKIAGLQAVIAMQKEVYMTYGANNPVVKLSHIAYATGLYIRELGFADPTRFMATVTPEMEEGLAQAAAEQAAKPTPEMLQHTAQMALIESNRKTAEEKNETARAKLMLDDDRQRDKMEQDFAVATAKILGDYGIAMDEAEVRRRMEENRQAEAEDRAANEMAARAVEDARPPAPQGNSGGPTQ